MAQMETWLKDDAKAWRGDWQAVSAGCDRFDEFNANGSKIVFAQSGVFHNASLEAEF
jgi:hypothetical protein